MKAFWAVFKKDKINWFSLVVLILAFAALVWFNFNRLTYIADADSTGEMGLYNLLSEEGGIISQNWHYSTELRILNTQLIMAPLFALIDNWFTATAVGNILLYIILIFSYCFMMRGLGVQLKWTLLTASCLLVGFSYSYFSFVLVLAYYIPHIILQFFIVGAFVRLLRAEDYARKYIVFLGCLYVFLAFMTGLASVRYLLIVHAPLLLAGFFTMLNKTEDMQSMTLRGFFGQKNTKIFLLGLIGIGVAAVGVLFNYEVLSESYTYAKGAQMGISFTEKSVIGTLDYTAGYLLEGLGYTKGAKLFSSAGIANLFVFVMVALVGLCTVWLYKRRKKLPRAQAFFCTFALMSFIVNVFAYSFLLFYGDEYTDLTRFYLPMLVLPFPVIAIYMQQQTQPLKKAVVAALLFGLV
ncbi:MAG: hypothetical protein ACOYJB_10220 [Christensenellaceae bacterium]